MQAIADDDREVSTESPTLALSIGNLPRDGSGRYETIKDPTVSLVNEAPGWRGSRQRP